MDKRTHIERSAQTLTFSQPSAICYVIYLTDVEPIVFPSFIALDTLRSISALSAVDSKLLFVLLSQKQDESTESSTVTVLCDGATVYEMTIGSELNSDTAWHVSTHLSDAIAGLHGPSITAAVSAIRRAVEDV